MDREPYLIVTKTVKEACYLDLPQSNFSAIYVPPRMEAIAREKLKGKDVMDDLDAITNSINAEFKQVKP